MATQQERAAKARDEKLAAIEQQVKEGSLVIRKMTAKERKENPPRSEPRNPRRRKF